MTDIRLSVLDTEKKYHYDYDEQVYGGDGIVSYGPDNNAPILFRNCYRNSATLKSIIDGCVNYLLGDSITVNSCAANWSKKVNRAGMTIRQFIANIGQSYFIYGGCAIQVIYNKLGTPIEFYPLDFTKVRTNQYGTKIFYAKKNWSKYSTKSEEFGCFDPENVDIKKGSQIFYFKGDFTNTVYPLPLYYAAIKDVLTEIECTNYSLNSVTNGFSARYILNLPDANNLTDEQKGGIEATIKEKFCGSETDTNFMLYWQDGENAMSVNKIEADDTPERFIAIKKSARENIFTSLRCTPNLFGLPTETTGFNSQEYADAFKLFDKTVIEPVRDIIREICDRLFGVEGAITIAPYSIDFNNTAKTVEE